MRTRNPNPPVLADRLPPHSPEAESAVLGGILLSPDTVGECVEAIGESGEAFYDLRNRTIWAGIVNLYQHGKPIDIITVSEQLKAGDRLEASGGFAYLSALPEQAPAGSLAKTHADIVVDKWKLRKVITLCAELLGDAYEHEAPGALIERLSQQAFELSRNDGGPVTVDIKTVLGDLIGQYEQAAKGIHPPRLVTGFCDLDKLIGGFSPGDLVVVGARTSVGKTSLALNVLTRVTLWDRKPGCIVSLEMTGKQLLHRLVCSVGRVDSDKLFTGQFDQDEMARAGKASADINGAPLHIVDRGSITLPGLRSVARQMALQHNITILALDYLNLVSAGGTQRSRYEELTTVAYGLKAIAKDLGITVLALAQLNRNPDHRDDEPRLSDLRDCGAIEEAADSVFLLHRKTDVPGEEKQVTLNVAKNRNGRVGRVDLIWLPYQLRFVSMAKVEIPKTTKPVSAPMADA